MQTAEKQQAVSDVVAPLDPVTVAAIGILAYMLGNVLHEGAGHGGACLLVGGKPLAISSVYFECGADSRLVMAAGTLMNLLAGAVFFALGRLTGRSYPRLKYFFWIAMSVNLFTGTGYFLFLRHQRHWRLGSIHSGARPPVALAHWPDPPGHACLSYLLAARISLLELRPLIGSDMEQRYQHAVRLSVVPYFAGGILMCIAGALNPQGIIAHSDLRLRHLTFGGTSGLMWTASWLKRGTLIPCGPPADPMPIQRSWPLIVAACAVALSFIAVFGPSIRFAS